MPLLSTPTPTPTPTSEEDTDFEEPSNLSKIVEELDILMGKPKNSNEFIYKNFCPLSKLTHVRNLDKLGFYDLLYEQGRDPWAEKIKDYVQYGFLEAARLGIGSFLIWKGLEYIF